MCVCFVLLLQASCMFVNHKIDPDGAEEVVGCRTNEVDDLAEPMLPNGVANNLEVVPGPFTVLLESEKTLPNHTRNFVVMTIQPGENALSPQHLAVTALLDPQVPGAYIRGCNGKSGRNRKYKQPLTGCKLTKLSADTAHNLSEGGAASFHIAVDPGISVQPGTSYRLVVAVAYNKRGAQPYTTAKSIQLTATKKSSSPSKRK